MNQVAVEGTITNSIWTYDNDTLFRLRYNDGEAYFTVRFRNLPLNIKPGTRVMVVGELTSRDQEVTLENFVSRAASNDDGGLDDEVQVMVNELAGKGLRPVNRSYTEIVARELRPLR